MNKFFFACILLLLTASRFAKAEQNLCSALSPYFAGKQTAKLPNPARAPTKHESAVIDGWKIELLDSTDYAKGVLIVDADNDGKPDVLAWNSQGSGRFVYAEVYELGAHKQ